MSHPIDLDRVLADWLQDGPYQAPEAPVEAAIQHARRSPHRRDVFAALRRNPMGRDRVGPFGLGYGLAAAVLIAIVVIIGIGGALLLRPAPPAPSPSPTPIASPGATASPTPRPSPSPGPSPSPTGSRPPFVRGPEPGDPIPGELLGAWYETSFPSFPFLLRAGDPFCVEVLKSAQDCSVWPLADETGRIGYETIATIQSGRLVFKWIGGPCNGQPARYDYTLTADRLTLRYANGGCGSGDFTFVRPGTNGAPTAPPQPGPS